MRSYEVGGGEGKKQIRGTTRTAAVETPEDNIRHNVRENIDGVPLGVTATAGLMATSLYPTDERPTKNHPAHNIGCRCTTTETVSWLSY